MRRKEREIKNPQDIRAILDDCKVMRVAFAVEGTPYMVPLNYGYTCENGIYQLCFHCAGAGKKLDLLQKNPSVCFEMDGNHALTQGERACDYSYQYHSIIGEGMAEIVTEVIEKKQLLSVLMYHQTGRHFALEDRELGSVVLCKIKVTHLCAKGWAPQP